MRTPLLTLALAAVTAAAAAGGPSSPPLQQQQQQQQPGAQAPLVGPLPSAHCTAPSYTARCPPPLLGSVEADGGRLAARIGQVLDDWSTPGLAVALVRRCPPLPPAAGAQEDGGGSEPGKDEWVVETRGFGWADEHEGREVTADTRFALASNTKHLTALAAGLVLSNTSLFPAAGAQAPGAWGKRRMKDLVPGWGLRDGWADAEATVEDTLSHRSGLPRHDLVRARQPVEDLIESVKHLRPSAGFREVWQYNNLHYMIAAYLPLFHLNTSFASYLHTHLFAPLGLDASGVSIVDALASGQMARGYTREDRREAEDQAASGAASGGRRRAMWPHLERDEGEVNWGAGGLIMSVRDAARWLQTLLADGRHPDTGAQVIPPALLDATTTGHSVAKTVGVWPEMGPTVYGMGQRITSYRGHRLIEHGGAVPGFRTQLARFPDAGVGLAVFVNDEAYGAEVHEVVKLLLADEALGLEGIDWNGRYKARRDAALADPHMPGPARPSNPIPPAGEFAHLGGTYHDAGYGTITLCAVELPLEERAALEVEGNGCRAVRERAGRMLPSVVEEGVPTFVAEVNRTYTSHLVLAHLNKSTFTLTPFSALRPVPPDLAYYAAQTDPPAVAVFERGGLGVLGGLWGAGEGVGDRVMEGRLEERAEVWFERVEA